MLRPFPRWQGNNGPEQADYVAVKNLIDATPRSVKRFLLTTSAGVDRSDKLPFSILNLFGAFPFPCMCLIYFAARRPLQYLPGNVAWSLDFNLAKHARAEMSCRNEQHCFGNRCSCHRLLLCAGVLKWKKEGERLLQASGLAWTIVRPNRLTDGPYTSYDLNTLLQVRRPPHSLCCIA